MSDLGLSEWDWEDGDDLAPEAMAIDGALVGPETFCRGCGCSELRACPGGCIWATHDLCSACVRKGVT